MAKTPKPGRSGRKPPPPSKKIKGGKGVQAATEAKASTHKHNDHGRTQRIGNVLYTYCTCGGLSATNTIMGDDE